MGTVSSCVNIVGENRTENRRWPSWRLAAAAVTEPVSHYGQQVGATGGSEVQEVLVSFFDENKMLSSHFPTDERGVPLTVPGTYSYRIGIRNRITIAIHILKLHCGSHYAGSDGVIRAQGEPALVCPIVQLQLGYGWPDE